MKLPAAGALGTGVYDPERVSKEMQKLWHEQGGRNIPGGNAVFKNSPSKTPEDSADLRTAAAAAIDAPFGDSYTDIVRAAFEDPSEVADAYDFSGATAQHDDVTLDPGGALHSSSRASTETRRSPPCGGATARPTTRGGRSRTPTRRPAPTT